MRQGKAAALAALFVIVAISSMALIRAAIALVDDGALVFNTSHVNDVAIISGVTGTPPTIKPGGSGSDPNIGLNIQGAGTGIVALGQAMCTATGVTPQVCNGQRGVVTTGTLTTAAQTSASFTITDSSVTAASMIQCTINSYSGTIATNGVPVITQCVPGSGSFAVNIFNGAPVNALNGAVGIGFVVMN